MSAHLAHGHQHPAPGAAGREVTPGPGTAEPGGGARMLAWALGLILAFMAAEVVIGLLAHSLALISDAAHMLTDAAAIGLALAAMRLSARPPAGGYTYGLRRTEILSAQAGVRTWERARHRALCAGARPGASGPPGPPVTGWRRSRPG